MSHQPIFSEKYLRRKLKSFSLDNFENVENKKATLAEIVNRLISGRTERTKEKSQQADFLNSLFGDVLDYVYKNEQEWNLEKEQTTQVGGKFADGALGYFKIANSTIKSEVRAVIELKDANTNLDKPQNRIDKKTPVEQGFSYVPKFGGKCKWVIVSNFKEIRLYHSSDESRYEKFDILNLLDNFQFKRLFFLLHNTQLILLHQKSVIDSLYEERQVQEQTISKKFYQEYKQVRIELFNHLRKYNQNIDDNILLSKAQKILDRVIFICFCEDLYLLPDDIFRGIIRRAVNVIDFSETKLWGQVKNLFRAIDKGYPQTNINKFNGGLFAEDGDLDNLIINDSVIEHLVHLSEYDFESDLNINILGHIFEQSISDLEELRANIEGQKHDSNRGKRKKDGIFYTPEYVTRYVVRKAVGDWLEKIRIELGVDRLPILSENDYASIKRIKVRNKVHKQNIDKLDYNKNIETHIIFLEGYRDKVAGIKVLDPACGSGAFLVQVFDFLFKEGQIINEELAKLRAGQREIFDLEKHILTNNIFGVDLNKESVELTKLSLWLKTANKQKELTTLDDNIQCGNSLIEDSKVVGESALIWNESFNHIMASGGFDVVVGNPPYVGEKGHSKIFEDLKKIPKWNRYYRRRSNTYYFFIKQGIDLLKSGGIQSLIIPREFTTADWANKVRKEILQSTIINEIVDFNDLKVFEDAGTTSLIMTHSKVVNEGSNYFFNLRPIRTQKNISIELYETSNDINFSANDLDDSGDGLWGFYQKSITTDNAVIPLKSLFDISQGLVTGADKITKKHFIDGLVSESSIGRGIFILRENIDIISSIIPFKININNRWIPLGHDDQKFIKSYIKTEGLNKWNASQSDLKIIYIGNADITENIKNYLMQFSSVLINRSTTLPEGEKITLSEFEKFSLENIKEKYSSAGAVQKIMRRKKWYLPLYERVDVPFSAPKIIVNTKNMDKFTYCDREYYSSGGGSGGQNYIYPVIKKDRTFFDVIQEKSSVLDFVKFTNAVLNSEKLQKFISDGRFNQLSTEKIGDLPIFKPDFSISSHVDKYFEVLDIANELIKLYVHRDNDIESFLKLLNSSFDLHDSQSIPLWYKLEYSAFVTELTKVIKKGGLNKPLTKQQELEWIEVFEKQKEKISIDSIAIVTKENKINKIVEVLMTSCKA